jgi:hypothetical protein
MKINRLSLILIAALCFFPVKAQYTDLYTFEPGKHLAGVNIGMKLANDNKAAYSAFYEYGLTNLFVDECMLGGGFFGVYFKDRLGKETQKVYIMGLRLNVHYQFVDRLDTYAGIAPNFNIKTYHIEKDRAVFGNYFHVGGRFYLTNWLAVFAEASTGFNNFSGGLSVKF